MFSNTKLKEIYKNKHPLPPIFTTVSIFLYLLFDSSFSHLCTICLFYFYPLQSWRHEYTSLPKLFCSIMFPTISWVDVTCLLHKGTSRGPEGQGPCLGCIDCNWWNHILNIGLFFPKFMFLTMSFPSLQHPTLNPYTRVFQSSEALGV